MSFEEKLTFHCDSDVGIQREENQDFYGFFPPEESGHGWLFVVADGMGGAAGGSTASKMAVNAIGREYSAPIADNGGDVFDAIRHAIEMANDEVYNRSQLDDDLRGMGTTANVVVFKDDVIYTAHVGDSRTYRFRDGRMERLTRDHTQVQELVDQGIITPGKAKNHPQGHIISRNLGGRAQVTVDIPPDGPFRVRDGDVFLVCSDGLYGLVDDEAIVEVLALAPPEESTPALIELANRRGGHDNITVCVVCAGTPPASWSRFSRPMMAETLEYLQSDRPTDTATFNVQYQDALEPADFDTSRLRAVARDDEEDSALPSRPARTEREMKASDDTEGDEAQAAPPAAQAASAPKAPAEAVPTAPTPTRKSRNPALVMLVIIVVLVGLLLISLAIGYVVFGDELSDAIGAGSGQQEEVGGTTGQVGPSDDDGDAANADARADARGAMRRRRRMPQGEDRDKPRDRPRMQDVPSCSGMSEMGAQITAPYIMRLDKPAQRAAVMVSYRRPEQKTTRSVHCLVNPGERVRLPTHREMLTFHMVAPTNGEIECSPRYEGNNPIDVHLNCTGRSEDIRRDLHP